MQTLPPVLVTLPDGRRGFARTGGERLLLVPRPLAGQVLVTAQALTGAGAPIGKPVSLLPQPVTTDIVFVPIPTGYSDATQRLAVHISLSTAPSRTAIWTLADLPPSRRNLPDAAVARTSATFGTLTLQAAAAEAPDLSDFGDDWNPLRARIVDGWTLDGPRTIDFHPRTGVPGIRCLLQAHNSAQPNPSPLLWQVDVDAITPQWEPLAPPRDANSQPPRRTLIGMGVFGYGNSRPDLQWQRQDMECGFAWPGQQRWLAVQGMAARRTDKQETVTFHGASLNYDAGSQCWRVVWRAPETVTTPSGIILTGLNARPAPPSEAPHAFAPQNAPLYLAWQRPSLPHPGLSRTTGIAPPRVIAPFPSTQDYSSKPPNWEEVWLPGLALPVPRPLRAPGVHRPFALPPSSPLQPMMRSGHQLARLNLTLPLPPEAYSNGAPLPPSPPLTRPLKDLTVAIDISSVVESHPFRLMLPVGKAFPAGWNPDAADGRSRQY